VAYHFEPRAAGESKASLRQGLTFVRHLVRLRGARLKGQLRERPGNEDGWLRQMARFAAFGAVGASGIFVNSGALWFFYHTLGLNNLLGAALATQCSTTWNFLLVDLGIYRKRANGSRLSRALRFYAMNNLLLLARLPVLQLLINAGLHILVANAITLAMLFVVRFVVSDRAIFAGRPESRRDPVRVLVDVSTSAGSGVPAASRKRSRYLPYRYDVAGVVTIGSQVALPELEFFRSQRIADGEVDIAVRIGDVGRSRPRKRAAMIESAYPRVIRYEEHLGRLGANFRAHIDERITVDVGPLLARSSHVVYTNILEPLLRFLMVSRGKMLLHSACVELGETGVMLSALTDTGKTGTVLRLLREHGGRFLSDDMTVIDRSGNASWFPKPLTISAHTLRAVSADDLTPAEWRRLQIQSRLHSRGGRSIGMALSRFNLPIMGINALTQMLIPPPKYTVDRLVPCRLTEATRVRELFIIERGSPGMADVDSDEALTRLLANTDDAYGFPPFRYLAPAITIGSKDYHELRAAERDILKGFLANVRVRTLASDNFSWADDIPRLLDAEAVPAAAMAAQGEGGAHSGNGRNGNGRAGNGSASWAAPAEGNGNGQRGDGLGKANGATVVAADGGFRQPAAGPGPALTGGASPVTVLTAAPEAPGLPVAAPATSGARGVAAGTPAGEVAAPRPLWRRLLYPSVPLAGVLAVACLLRFWHLAAVGYNTDEAVYTGSAASIAGNSTLTPMFPVFRAHPLMFQMLLSLILRVHDSDWTARAFAAVIGIATVAVTYLLARRLYGTTVALVAALLVAVMPYHVIVSRQVLLDGLMTLCLIVALYCVVRYVESARVTWLLAGAGSMSAAILSKETSAVVLGSFYLFFALTPGARARGRQLWLALLLVAGLAAVWPVMLRLGGHSRTGSSYLVWQLFRRSNHPTWFYFTALPSWIGPAVLAAAAAGLVWLRREASWRERLLLAWLAVPALFFTLWPVKGFQYLLPAAPALAILAARPVTRLTSLRPSGWLRTAGRVATAALVTLTTASLAIPSWALSQPSARPPTMAGTGGMVGGRQAGQWVAQHVPLGSRLLAIGPSTANVLEFYGHREVSALSVSAIARDRNPSYQPVINPDLDMREGTFQYIVWDAYTASRTPFFAADARRLTSKYHGVAVFTATIKVPASSGQTVDEAVFIIYKVHP
jgi:4-amino-4-deoxy-L-arabinose transferase-like glycosyltransferase/putative flippase GtrA